jgi:predicted nucleic acid-binding protein
VDFLDTNVLVYAISHRQDDQPKAAVARSLIRFRDQAISLQVLQEFYHATRQPRKLGLTHDEAILYCGQWRKFTVLEPTLAMFDEALRLCGRFQISYYDAAILAAAKQLGCAKVYSEDLNDGQDYDGVRVENPFHHVAASSPPP